MEIDLAQMALHRDDATGRLILVFADGAGRKVGVRTQANGLDVIIQSLTRLTQAYRAKTGSTTQPAVVATEPVSDFRLVGWSDGETVLDVALQSGPLRLTFGPAQLARLQEALADVPNVPEVKN